MFVRPPPKVSMLTRIVSISRTALSPVSPRLIVWPVTSPIVRTNGTVSASVASAEPKHRLMDRCSLLARAASSAAMLSGARIRQAMRIPPKAVGMFNSVMPCSTMTARYFDRPMIGTIVKNSIAACPAMARPRFAGGVSSGSAGSSSTSTKLGSTKNPRWRIV